MNALKTLFVIGALTLSSLAMAEGGGDRTFSRMQQAEEDSTLVAQQQQKTATPVAETNVNNTDHTKC
ncbi:co-regulatory protein PtrA N-terminal domain-containing protein [Pseudomonas paeninsulae]|uniref:co-regulatory protein PtrA N-terminal domain-containing protein n=1 Tax=Pseudomonas paeninsulae TaxID=3110772 RepID=UPI002D776256|nr:co-regulatory protein PtrA N-terminal domain-containing protein [Pseudomonas sp. IT1137]